MSPTEVAIPKQFSENPYISAVSRVECIFCLHLADSFPDMEIEQLRVLDLACGSPKGSKLCTLGGMIGMPKDEYLPRFCEVVANIGVELVVGVDKYNPDPKGHLSKEYGNLYFVIGDLTGDDWKLSMLDIVAQYGHFHVIQSSSAFDPTVPELWEIKDEIESYCREHLLVPGGIIYLS